MQTRVSAFAARVAEGGWLAALLVVPLLFHVYTDRVFEEDKIPLMRSIALVLMLALVVWGMERGRQALRVRERPLWRAPLVLPTLILTGAYLLSTTLSILPQVSFWGAYIRRQGTFTWVSYLVFFFAILLLVRQRRQVERVVTVILLGSVPASLYAFLQHSGLDPLPWGGDVVERVASTAGNPIFIAAYLIMVLPLTLARVIEYFTRLLGPAVEGQRASSQVSSSLLAGAYLFLLVLQLMAIVYSQSRGPWLGLGVGLVFFGILCALHYSRFLTVGIAALTVASLAFLVVFNLPNSPLEPLREVGYVGRLGQVFEVDEGTGRVRVLIWEGASDLLVSNPARALVGYGPETMYVAFNPYYPPELGQIEQRNAAPDRAHNETFDSLVMTGVLGFAAQTLLFLALFYYILQWLGLINTAGQRNLFIASILAGALGGAILPYLMDGTIRMSGVGLPAGIALGLIAYLLLYALTHLKRTRVGNRLDSLLLIALLSGIIAHFVEIHFGIAIAATRLYFWIYAALAVVVGWSLVQQERDDPEPVPVKVLTNEGRRQKRRGRARPVASERRFPVDADLWTLSLMMSLILALLTFNFVTPTIRIGDSGSPLVWLFLGTWLVGLIVVSMDATPSNPWQRRAATYSAISLGGWLLFCLFFIPWINWRPPSSGSITPDQLRGFAGHMSNAISVVYIFTFGIISVSGATLLRGEANGSSPGRGLPTARLVLYGVLALAIVPIIVAANLNISRADVFSKQGTGYENSREWMAARILYEEALRLQPREDRYFLNMGRVLLAQAREVQGVPAERDRYLQQADEVLVRAHTTNPLNTDHMRNLASLHRVWAGLLSESAEQARHLDLADHYYEQALERSPNNVSLWNDWAALDIERQQYDGAQEKLDHSLSLDDQFINTYLLQASLAIEREQFEIALQAYDQALALNPSSLVALSGKSLALARMERVPEAIEVSQQALLVAPDDFTTHKNLALLYQQADQPLLALESARAALAVASPADQPGIENLIRQLTEQSRDGTPGG
jgi:tetratricopeptide (TPR) repeat protein